MTLAELDFDFVPLMFHNENGNVKGFKIGKGKTIYWHIGKQLNNGKFRVWPQYDDGMVGSVRYHDANSEIKLIFK